MVFNDEISDPNNLIRMSKRLCNYFQYQLLEDKKLLRQVTTYLKHADNFEIVQNGNYYEMHKCFHYYWCT